MAEASRYGERRELEEYLRAMREDQMKIQEKLGEMQLGEQREMAEKLFELKRKSIYAPGKTKFSKR